MAARVALNTIKEYIQSLFQSNNTTTASVIDLSANLSQRVRGILKINPEMLPVQASLYPLVTCYIDSKDIKGGDIATNQLNSKRRATVNIGVVGAVFNQNCTNYEEHPSNEDINYLMENVELILRTDHNLASSVT